MATAAKKKVKVRPPDGNLRIFFSYVGATKKVAKKKAAKKMAAKKAAKKPA